MPCHLRAVEGHGEEEAQRRNRAVDARRTHAGLRLMQLKTPKVLRRGGIRRAAEEGCERPDVPDIVVARLLDEVAHAHVFDHALAQRADGLLAHLGAPVLRWRLLTPLDPQDGTPICHRIRLTRSLHPPRHSLRPSRAARSRVSGFVLWHKPADSAGAEHVRSAPVDQTSTCSAIVSAPLTRNDDWTAHACHFIHSANLSSDKREPNMTDTPEYTPPEVWVWEKGDTPQLAL